MYNHDSNFQDGLRGKSFSGEGAFAREQFRQGRMQRFDLSGPKPDQAGGGSAGGGLAAAGLLFAPLIVFALAVTPVAGFVALAGAALEARRLRAKGEAVPMRALFVPMLAASFWVVLVFLGSAFLLLGASGVFSVLFSLALAAGVGGGIGAAFYARMTGRSRGESFLDVQRNVVAPSAVILLVFVIGYIIGVPLPDIVLIQWMLWTGIAGIVIAVQAALVFALIMRVMAGRRFVPTLLSSGIAVFLALFATACVFYFLQFGGRFLDAVGGRSGVEAGASLGGIFGGALGFALLNVPGVLICRAVLGMTEPPMSGAGRWISAILLTGICTFLFLNGARAMY
ncbi:hypothetical protein [Pseudooceanicola sp.]|uniref:hypothetical protein n=1 Tax=Pseudooceanicola sp. TaxID=1914328 RepID=UPI0035C75F0C